MREIVLDTETTGLDPCEGHRIVEIACIELVHHVPTGRRFHRYVNPERDIPADALAVHGLTAEFLAQQPLFPALWMNFLRSSVRTLWSFIMLNSTWDFSMQNWHAQNASQSLPGLSTRWRWRGGAFQVPQRASMPCAGASTSTFPIASSTGRRSIAACHRLLFPRRGRPQIQGQVAPGAAVLCRRVLLKLLDGSSGSFLPS